MIKPRQRKVTIQRKIAKYALSFKYGFRISKPLMMARIAYNYLYYLVKKKPRPRFVDLAVTYRCNLNCIHCSATRLKQERPEHMSIEDIRRIGKQLRRAGVAQIQLTGGEPLLRKDLEEVIRALGPGAFFISVSTNSTLVTKERLASLKKAGLDNLCVSIDDWNAQEHDRWRGLPGIHEKALQAVTDAKAAGLRAMIFTVATHANVRSDAFLKLLEFAGEKKVLVIVGWAVPTGNWNANRDILLTGDDLEYLETLHEKYLYVRTDFETNYFHFGCGAVKEKLYITTYGDVIPCAFVHIKLGNIFEESLESIRERAMRVDWFREYNSLCLAANDPDFREKHMSRVFAADQEPIPFDDAGFDMK